MNFFEGIVGLKARFAENVFGVVFAIFKQEKFQDKTNLIAIKASDYITGPVEILG